MNALHDAGLISGFTTQGGAEFRSTNDSIPLNSEAGPAFDFSALVAEATAPEGFTASQFASPAEALDYVHYLEEQQVVPGYFGCPNDTVVTTPVSAIGAAAGALDNASCASF
jgi:hypothetical protein